MSSEERFGFEWNKYSRIDPNHEIQFKKWVYPLNERDFIGRKVLDAGCGMGRNSYWVKKWGAGQILAFDYDKRSVEAARSNLKDFSNIKVEFKNIYEIDWENEFDIVFSIGVIHHLEEPKKAIKNLVRAIKPGGRIIICVYSHEGNEWFLWLVNPIRKYITSRLSVSLVHFISYFVSIPLGVFVKIFKGPGVYLKQLSGFKFWHIHSIVFDQLIPTVANYWCKEELESLLTDSGGLEDIKFYSVNNNTWTAIAKKKQKDIKLFFDNDERANKRYKNFIEWNDEMIKKFDLEHYHSSNLIIRFIESLRVKYILKFLDIRRQDKIIEIGCGAGDILAKIDKGDLTGVDISEYILDIASRKYGDRGVKFVVGNAENLPEEIKKEKYDKIFCSEVLEHVENPAEVLKEIKKIAHKKSVIVISIPHESLIDRVKSILQKLRILKLFFAMTPLKMTDEWHLHYFDLGKLKNMVQQDYFITNVKGVPHRFLPLRYVVKLKMKND